MSIGGTWLALQSATKPYRLIIPLILDVDQWLSNVESGPHELKALQDLRLLSLIDVVPEHDDEVAAQCINDAAHAAQMAKWWVEEDWRRYEGAA